MASFFSSCLLWADQEIPVRRESTSLNPSSVGDGGGDKVPIASGAALGDSSPAAPVLLEGAQVRVAGRGTTHTAVRVDRLRVMFCVVALWCFTTPLYQERKVCSKWRCFNDGDALGLLAACGALGAFRVSIILFGICSSFQLLGLSSVPSVSCLYSRPCVRSMKIKLTKTNRQRTRRAGSAGGKGGVVRPRPGGGGSAGSVDAASDGAVKGDVVAGSDSHGTRSEGESCSSKEESIVAAAAASGSNSLKVSGRKRREAPGDTSQAGEKERRGGNAAGATSKRVVGGGDVGGGGGGAVGGRMEGRLGNRNAAFSADEGGRVPFARESQEKATSPRIQNGVPKRMRLVAPSGVVVSQVRAETGDRGRERTARSRAVSGERRVSELSSAGVVLNRLFSEVVRNTLPPV